MVKRLFLWPGNWRLFVTYDCMRCSLYNYAGWNVLSYIVSENVVCEQRFLHKFNGVRNLPQQILSYFQANFRRQLAGYVYYHLYNHDTHKHTYICPRPTDKRRNGAGFPAQVYRCKKRVQIGKFLVPETCHSGRGFRLWPKRPAWDRNVQEPKRHVRGPKRSYINFGELVCRRFVMSASWLSATFQTSQRRYDRNV